MTQDGG
jgi:hypothetical protein